MRKNFLTFGNFALTILLALSVVLTLVSLRRVFTTSSKAANVCTCTEGGSCSIEGQYCEKFAVCDSTNPLFNIYQCLHPNGDATKPRVWTFLYQQNGSFQCQGDCGTPIPSPTGANCSCSGGTYDVLFKAARTLTNGESISCSLSSSGNCTCGGVACTGAYKSGNCTIQAGQQQCYISNLDCSCKPFTYDCTGSGVKNGTLTSTTVVNGGSTLVNIPLPSAPPTTPTPSPTIPGTTITVPPSKTPTPSPTVPGTTITVPPSKTPTPTVTKTPTPTVPVTATPTPTVTITVTPTIPPSGTPTPTVTNTPQATNTPAPTYTPFPTLTPQVVPPTYTPYPTATPIIYAQQPTPVPQIPSAGFDLTKMWPIAVSLVLLGIGIVGVIL